MFPSSAMRKFLQAFGNKTVTRYIQCHLKSNNQVSAFGPTHFLRITTRVIPTLSNTGNPMTPELLQEMTVTEIKSMLVDVASPEESLLQYLENDPRSGVQKLAIQTRRRQRELAKEQARLENMAALENKLRERGLLHIAGVDEAGRGPLAGPVVAAAVILPPKTLIAGLNDSKKLKESVRDSLFDEIKRVAISVGVGQATPEEIDSLNIRNATHLAMRRALNQLTPAPNRALIDGNAVPESNFEEMAIIGGDRKSLSIAAASIIAKVTRDRQMQNYAKEYPQYGFAGHKGYGSAEHLKALQEYGPSPIHRLTFGGVPAIRQTFSEDYDAFLDGIESAKDLEQLEAMGKTIASVSSNLETHEIESLRTRYKERLGKFDKVGTKGETLAAEFLKAKGFTICAQNYRTNFGEIDLIVKKEDSLRFVEVKTAKQSNFGDPSSWVTPKKQAQIVKLAKTYLSNTQSTHQTIQFDVITINMTTPEFQITHIESAFTERC